MEMGCPPEEANVLVEAQIGGAEMLDTDEYGMRRRLRLGQELTRTLLVVIARQNRDTPVEYTSRLWHKRQCRTTHDVQPRYILCDQATGCQTALHYKYV
eukprot:scaffold71668_cov44-Prasinocladus_malaysianus.AAC.2